jgi:hypothetical protein
VSDPISHPYLYDSIILDGVTSPGVVTISGHKRAQEWDIKKGSGQDGGSTERKGTPVAQFTLTFELVNDPERGNQIDAWDLFQPVIERSTSGAAPVALRIEHADLARLGITEVVNGGIGGMLHDGKGGATVTWDALEYRPAKAKGGAPTANKAADPNDPNAAAKAALNALVTELEGP